MNAVHIHMYLKHILVRLLENYKTPLLHGYLFTPLPRCRGVLLNAEWITTQVIGE